MNESLLYINLGCGPVQPPGWINVDYSNRARFVKAFSFIDRLMVRLGAFPPTEFTLETTVFDVRKRFPFGDESVSAFYSGELLEHLLPRDADHLMRECYRTLLPGGVIRINVPDNFNFWKRYCNAYEKMLAKPRSEWNDEYASKWIGMFWNDICTRRPFFGSMGHFHKWAYDEISLTLLFERSGFVNVSRKHLHDSKITRIKSVEMRSFLTIEAEKPS